jgi:HEAT repeat protein
MFVSRLLMCLSLGVFALTGGSARAQQSSDTKTQPSARGEEAFAQAIEQLKSTEALVRAQAADEMGRRGYRLRKEIAAILRPLLREDAEPVVRAAAGRALGRLGVREAVPDLIGALADKSADVRVVAAAALWRLPDPSAVPALLERCKDSEAAAREWSALALGVIGDRKAVAQLVSLLDDSVRSVRLAAVRSLGRVGDPVAIKPLLGYLSAPQRDDEEKDEVINSLASIHSPERVHALVQLLSAEHDDTQKIRLIMALGQVGDAPVIPRLKRHTESGQPSAVRNAATEAIASVQQRVGGKPGETGKH